MLVGLKNNYCKLIKGDCKNYCACQYMKNRFKTLDCVPDEFKLPQVDNIYKKELKNRAKLLASGNFHTGNDYVVELDKRVKKVKENE